MNEVMSELWQRAAAINPEKTALIVPDKKDASFADLDRQITRTVEKLRSFGVGRNAHLGLLVHSRDCAVTAHLAIQNCAVSAPLNPEMPPAQLEWTIENYLLDMIVVEDSADPEQIEICRRSGIGIAFLKPDANLAGAFDLELEKGISGFEPVSPEPDDNAVLLHTSGTTGRPKIVPLTQRNRFDAHYRGGVNVGEEDVSLCVLPLDHIQGLEGESAGPILKGGTAVMERFNPGNFVDLVEKYQPTYFTLVPSMHHSVLSEARRQGKRLGPNRLRFIRSSSSMLPVALRKEMEDFYGVPYTEGLGSTEAGGISGVGLPPIPRKEGSVGKLSHEGIRFVGPDGQDVEPGEPGEIWVKGPGVIHGFLNNPEANERLFENGWYKTGDVGHVDADGFLFMHGRASETITRGGEKIAPAEIDDVLAANPDVDRAAAFGVPDPKLGEEVWAAVVPVAGASLTPGQMRSYASRELPFAKVPKRIVIVDELPYNELGKVLRRRLSELYSDESRLQASG